VPRARLSDLDPVRNSHTGQQPTFTNRPERWQHSTVASYSTYALAFRGASTEDQMHQAKMVE
jgi:hypothetical protein